MPAIDGARCLVTGATGFLGQNLVSALAAQGARVMAVGRRSEKLAPLSRMAKTFAGDLTCPQTADSIIGDFRPDIVYHLAGNVTGAADLKLTLPMFQDNTAATVYLLNAAVGRVKRVVTVGSIEEYSTSPTALTPYAVAKRSASDYVDYFRASHSLPLTQVVLHFGYGPHQPKSKFIPSVVMAYLEGRVPQVGMPERECDFVFIDDVVSAFIRAVEIESQDLPLEIKSGKKVSLQTVAEQIRLLVNSSAPAASLGVPDRPQPRIDVEASYKLLDNWGWQPEITLERGLTKTIDWYRNNATGSADASGNA